MKMMKVGTIGVGKNNLIIQQQIQQEFGMITGKFFMRYYLKQFLILINRMFIGQVHLSLVGEEKRVY
jgi:hypothetical protein